MATAIYVRVSSIKQDFESQMLDLKMWAANNEADGIEWFEDTYTGKTMNRPGWRELEAKITDGKIDTLVVWRLDRLGRTAAGLTTLFDKLIAAEVNLISLRDGIDLSSPAGRLMANVIASVAQYETEVRRERIQAGLDAKRERGEKWGGGKPGRRVTVTEEKEAKVREMLEKGLGSVDAAKVSELSRTTVWRLRKKLQAEGIAPAQSCQSGAK